MGSFCCKKDIEINEEIDSCESISDIRNYISSKLENASIEQDEIKLYLEDKSKIPTLVEVDGINDEDLNKRVLYLDEMKIYLNKIDELLKNNSNVDITDIQNSLKEFISMYAWIYDDSKRYIEWFKVFQNYIEENENKIVS